MEIKKVVQILVPIQTKHKKNENQYFTNHFIFWNVSKGSKFTYKLEL